MSFRFKVGDTAKSLVIPLTDNDDPLTNLADAESVEVRGIRGGTVVVSDTDPTVNTTDATVTHEWAADEVSQAGRIWVDVIVTWPGDKRQSYPDSDLLAVDIEPAI